jgi:hypothetical protein
MTDFETHPVGTTQRLKDLEFELAIFRKTEENATYEAVTKVSDDLKDYVKYYL